MKKVLFILLINFLICNCLAEFALSDALGTFISYLGVYRNPAQYEEIPSDSSFADPEPGREHDPLDLLLASFDGETLLGTVGNPMLFGQYIRNDDFVDILFACPKKDDKKQTKTEKGYEKVTRDLFIEENYISIVTRLQLEEKTSKKDISDNIDYEMENASTSNYSQEEQSKQDAVLHQEKIQRRGNVLGYTSMELDSDKDVNHEDTNLFRWKKNKRKNSSELATPEDKTIPKKNKADSADKQEENQKNDVPDHNKMEIDSASIIKTDGTNLNKTETPNPESETQKSKTPVPKIKTANDSLTPETEKFWVQALDEVKNFKCQEPVRVYLVEYPMKSMYKAYIAGFMIFVDKHEGWDLPEFAKLPNEKYKFFWSFTIIFTEPDRNVVCVYHEVQYNKDTYSPEINDNFDGHDLGKDMLFPDINISQLYSIENQTKVFQKLFRKQNTRKLYFDPDEGRFLVKVHLAPLHGFVTPAVRQSAKTYGNIAPMWNSIRNGAWRKIEDYVNILSHVLIDLIVITGTYGILNLEGRDVYLADGKVPVPQLFWKLVIYGPEVETSHGMLIITSNDPYKSIDDMICEDDTSRIYGWKHIQEYDIAKGRTISCPFHPGILQKLPILRGAQPSKILDLDLLSEAVNDIWEFNELGVKTTEEQRKSILDKLKPPKNQADEKIATDEEIYNNLENKRESKNDEKIISNDEKIGENSENENKKDEKAPLSFEITQDFPFPKRQVKM